MRACISQTKGIVSNNHSEPDHGEEARSHPIGTLSIYCLEACRAPFGTPSEGAWLHASVSMTASRTYFGSALIRHAGIRSVSGSNIPKVIPKGLALR